MNETISKYTVGPRKVFATFCDRRFEAPLVQWDGLYHFFSSPRPQDLFVRFIFLIQAGIWKAASDIFYWPTFCLPSATRIVTHLFGQRKLDSRCQLWHPGSGNQKNAELQKRSFLLSCEEIMKFGEQSWELDGPLLVFDPASGIFRNNLLKRMARLSVFFPMVSMVDNGCNYSVSPLSWDLSLSTVYSSFSSSPLSVSRTIT